MTPADGLRTADVSPVIARATRSPTSNRNRENAPPHRRALMNRPTKAVRLAGRELGHSCHACAFFHSREEEYRVLLPFAKEGFERGETAYHVVDPEHRPERIRRLEEVGIGAAAAADGARDGDGDRHPGQIEIRVWEEAHLRGGYFAQEAMFALIEETLTSGKAHSPGLTRVWANMEWALEDRPGVQGLVEYEARLNQILPRYDAVVVCTYDLTRFDAGIVLDALRTHPLVIIGGILQENPFYMEPDEFLREYRARDVPAMQG
jgi:hypothetical protein